MIVQHKNPDRLTIWQVLGSVLASFFGVQSSRNRARDFTSGKARDFILVGFILTVVCCFTLFFLVSMIIRIHA